MSAGLSALLSPDDIVRFLAAFVEKQPLKLLTWRDDLARFFPWAELNRCISIDTLVSGRAKLLRAGREVPLDLVSKRRDNGERVLLAEALHLLCEQGLSIQLIGLHSLTPKIAALTAALERELRADLQVNAYASFTRGGALPPHADGHDVLILQIDGSKLWKGYGGSEARPLKGGIARIEQPSWEEELQPGDLLYLPRGEVHHAKVVGERSLHLTIGIQNLKACDSLSWLRERGIQDILFREDIAPQEPGDAADRRSTGIKQALHALVDQLDLRDMLADRDRRVAPFRPLNLGFFGPLAPRSWVSPSLRRYPDLPAEGEARIEADGVQIALDSAERALLIRLLDSGGSRVDALLQGPEAEATERALSGLIRKSLLFVLDD